MSVACPILSAKNAYTYEVTYSGPIEADNTERLRFLLDYRNASKYDCLERKTGLYVDESDDISSVDYISWDTIARPPMTEPATEDSNWTDESFNIEIVVTLHDNDDDAPTISIPMSAYIDSVAVPLTVPSTLIRDDCMLSGESFIPVNSLARHRTNVLAETLVESTQIASLSYRKGVVTVVTFDPHGFIDGDAITISGVERCAHSQGVNGERYNGIYRISNCTTYSFTYSTLFDGNEYTADRVYDADNSPTASKWVAHSWNAEATLCDLPSNGILKFMFDMYNNDVIAGDTYLLKYADGTTEKITVSSVDNGVITASYSGKPISGTELNFTMAPRVPSADVPVNYDDASAENIPTYSHVDNMGYIAVYDDTTVASTYNGTINVASPILKLSSDDVVVFKFNPGYRVGAANTMEVTCHITGNTYPKCTLTLYEMDNAEWDMTIDRSYVDEHIVYDVLDIATIDNPGICGGTAVRFVVTGSAVERWYADSKPVALAIKVLDVNSIDSMHICATEGEYPITVVGGAGKQATINPEKFNVMIKPSVPMSGEEMTILARGNGSFSGVPGYDVVKINDIECEIVASTRSSLIVKIPDDLYGTSKVTVYRVSNGSDIQVTNTTTVNIEATRVSDIKLGDKMRTGLNGRIVSRSASYSKDIAFNGFTEVTDANNMIQNIYNILLTNKGERLFNREFGANIESMLFSIYDSGNYRTVITECANAIAKYEPRVTVDADNSYVKTDDGGNHVYVYLAVIIPGTSEQLIELPFYNRGKVV